jgi:uncharacterized phiE125 gp8 family phage protein
MQVTDKLITPNATLAVSVSEFKKFLRWEQADTSEDTLMTAFLGAAQEQARLFTGRSLLTETWQALFDNFPAKVTLTKCPVTLNSIVVKYYDSNNAEQILASSEYKIVDGGEFGMVSIKFDGNIPSTYDKPQACFVQYDSGYTTVPDPVKVAIMIQAGSYFENRTSEVAGTTVSQIMYGAQQLLYPYKVFYNNV